MSYQDGTFTLSLGESLIHMYNFDLDAIREIRFSCMLDLESTIYIDNCLYVNIKDTVMFCCTTDTGRILSSIEIPKHVMLSIADNILDTKYPTTI